MVVRLVSSSIVGVWRLISENAVRGANPNCFVKISKIQARQTSVVNSVTVPLGKPERSISRLGLVATGEFNHTRSFDYQMKGLGEQIQAIATRAGSLSVCPSTESNSASTS